MFFCAEGECGRVVPGGGVPCRGLQLCRWCRQRRLQLVRPTHVFRGLTGVPRRPHAVRPSVCIHSSPSTTRLSCTKETNHQSIHPKRRRVMSWTIPSSRRARAELKLVAARWWRSCICFLDTGRVGLVPCFSQPRALVVRGAQLDEAPPLLLRPAGVNEYDTLVSFVFVLSLVAFVLFFSFFCRFFLFRRLFVSCSLQPLLRRTPNVVSPGRSRLHCLLCRSRLLRQCTLLHAGCEHQVRVSKSFEGSMLDTTASQDAERTSR